MAVATDKKQEYTPKKYEHLLGMQGFSDKLLTTHFKLYEGYVTNTNLQLEELSQLLKEDKQKLPLYSEVKRRLGWEFNGMRLHEYYFDNLGGKKPVSNSSHFYKRVEKQFGSFDMWKKDFIATGGIRGIGWAALYADQATGRLVNFWIEEHNANHLAGAELLLIMDVFEHAFIIDYGTERDKYIDSFFKNIDWDVVDRRCRDSESN